MPDLDEGFLAFHIPSDQELDRALIHSLVVLDANVLLDVYRYVDQTRSDLFRVLESVGDRLWVPHQAAHEFWRNRVSVMGDRLAAFDELRRGLAKARDNVTQSLDQWSRATAGDSRSVADQLDTAFARALDAIDAMSPEASPSYVTADDPIVDRLRAVLVGKVGEAPDDEEWNLCVAEGRRRTEAEEPPGYLDAPKEGDGPPEGAAGDYLVWHQLMQESRRRELDVVFVTRDQKEDWWWRYRSVYFGPRRELTDEFRTVTGRRIYMLRPGDLLARSRALQVAVADESIEDANRGTELVPWPADGVVELLRRLDSEGREQADVIRAAAVNGGWVSRDEVYELCGFPEDRMLRGFTRPARRITADLQSEGLVSTAVAPAIEAHYPTGVRTAGFAIPQEMVGVLQADDARLPVHGES